MLGDMHARRNQRDLVLQELREACGQWVAAFRVAQAGGLQWQSRLWELRHKWHYRIENRTERDHKGQVHSFYRLVPSTPATAPLSEAEAETESSRLFPDLPLHRHHLDLG